jgi:glycosyltransferase involved in cell wall biosynthesis
MSIYFLTPDYDFPSGGVRIIYRHVDILNAHGIPAYVLHRKDGFRCDWFKNSTPVAYLDASFRRRVYFKLRERFRQGQPREWHLLHGPKERIGEDDILVLPEIYGPAEMIGMAPGVPKAILNQGCYLTFRQYPLDRDKLLTPYGHKDFKAVLTNSEAGLKYLNHVFPDLKVARFHPSIDPVLFQFGTNKKRRICFSTRKSELAMRQVINILKFRNALLDFELMPFDGKPQAEVAKIFEDSAFFLSFSSYEGFGLPPAEAMASGCIVIGYHGGGGKEFFLPEFSYPVEAEDIIGFAAMIERVLREYADDAAPFAIKAEAAAQFIRQEYSPEREAREVSDFWRGLLASL